MSGERRDVRERLTIGVKARGTGSGGPAPGTYREHIDDDHRALPLDVVGATTGDPMTVTVPSNYGYVFTKVG